MRVTKTIAIVVGAYLVGFLVELFAAYNSPEYGGGILIFYFMVLLAIAGPKVGYRWFDCFFAFIPFYNVFFLFRIAYRLAFLPNKDWAERQT